MGAEALEVLIGEWSMEVSMPGATAGDIGARVTFEWLPGERFLLERLWRETPDFSPLDFAQRFEGTFSDDGDTINGRWDIRHEGRDWEKDFDLDYRRLS
jgi:hypothetical protein